MELELKVAPKELGTRIFLENMEVGIILGFSLWSMLIIKVWELVLFCKLIVSITLIYLFIVQQVFSIGVISTDFFYFMSAFVK